MQCPACNGKGIIPCDAPGYSNVYSICYICEGLCYLKDDFGDYRKESSDPDTKGT